MPVQSTSEHLKILYLPTYIPDPELYQCQRLDEFSRMLEHKRTFASPSVASFGEVENN